MVDPTKETAKSQAVIDLLVISEIMTTLADHAQDHASTVAPPWLAFLGCAVANAAHRLAGD